MTNDRPDGHPRGLDPESEKWWAELTRLDEAPVAPRRAPRSRRRVSRRHSRRERTAGRSSRSTRALVGFLGLMVAAGGAISFVERGWEQTRIATLDAGGGVDQGAVIEGEDGQYAFMRTQRGSQEPVTYPACRPIAVEINPSGEVPGGTQIIVDSLARIGELAGVELAYTGPTTERPGPREERLSTEGYDGDPPVLVAWSTPEETPQLAGDVVGIGGSVSVRGGALSTERYVTGSVILDSPGMAQVYDDHGTEAVQAVVLHELGHLLGLGHVGDPAELMAPANTGQTDFGDGDREGLARLGSAGAC